MGCVMHIISPCVRYKRVHKQQIHIEARSIPRKRTDLRPGAVGWGWGMEEVLTLAGAEYHDWSQVVVLNRFLRSKEIGTVRFTECGQKLASPCLTPVSTMTKTHISWPLAVARINQRTPALFLGSPRPHCASPIKMLRTRVLVVVAGLWPLTAGGSDTSWAFFFPEWASAQGSRCGCGPLALERRRVRHIVGVFFC